MQRHNRFSLSLHHTVADETFSSLPFKKGNKE